MDWKKVEQEFKPSYAPALAEYIKGESQDKILKDIKKTGFKKFNFYKITNNI